MRNKVKVLMSFGLIKRLSYKCSKNPFSSFTHILLIYQTMLNSISILPLEPSLSPPSLNSGSASDLEDFLFPRQLSNPFTKQWLRALKIEPTMLKITQHIFFVINLLNYKIYIQKDLEQKILNTLIF